MDDSGKFWRWARLRVDAYKFPSQADDLLTSGVLFLVPEIGISPCTSRGTVESLLQAVSEGKTPLLKALSASDSLVPLAHVAAVNLEGLSAVLSSVQVRSLFSRISESPDLRLTQLDLDSSSVSEVPQEMFAVAVSRLERVSWRSGVTAVQLDSLFMRLISDQAGVGGPKLKELEIIGANLMSVSPAVLVGGNQRLEKVRFWGGRMTAVQINSLFTMLGGNEQGRLKQIKISYHVVAGSVSQNLLQQARLNNDVRIQFVNF